MEHGRLCITRKPAQPVLIQYTDEHGQPQQIELIIEATKGKQSRLAFNAPLDVKILRGELLAKNPI